MAKTKAQIQKEYRTRKKAAMGADAYKNEQTRKRKARRNRSTQQAVAEQPPAIAPTVATLAIIDTGLKTKAQIQKEYRTRKKAAMGADAYKNEQTRKRNARRNRSTQQAVAEQPPAIEPETKTANTCDNLASQIWTVKNARLKSKGKKNISLSSVKAQLKKVENLYKWMNGKTTECTAADFEFLHDFNKVIDFINKKYLKPNTRNSYIQAISSVLVSLDGYNKTYKKYSFISTRNRKKINEEAKKNEKTDNEKKNWMSYKELQDVLKKVKDPRDRALIGLYVLMPPRRVADVSLICLNTKNKMFNSYDPSTGIIHYRVFKYDKSKKSRKVKLTKPANNIFKKYIKDRKLKNGDLLFGTNKGTVHANFSPEVTATFSKYIKDKKITANILRHIFISDFLSRSHSDKQKEKIALDMGQSVRIQSHYNRIESSDDLEEDEVSQSESDSE